ncbi:MAG: hypothetical protein MI919_26985, partial [Holophagales bacterium]|nr:hypothetical protein [Holophagales bacterium]
MAKVEDYLVGIDIGSSKVGVLIAQRADDARGGDQRMEVVGKGLAPNRGTRRGNIVNVEQTVEALKQATEEAEVMAGVDISRAYVGIARILKDRGQYADASRHLAAALVERSDDAEALVDWAALLEAQGRVAKAAAVYRHASQL